MSSITAALFLALVATSASATTFVNRPLGEVVKEASSIVRGRSGDNYSDWDKSGQKAVYTYTYFTVTDVLKGKLKDTKIKLRQPGGAKDGVEMNVPGTANFAVDEDVVVLLGPHNTEDDSYDVPGFATGKYNVVTGENGEPFLVNSLGGGAMYDPSKDIKALSYNAKVPLEVFKRIAQGEDIPEAAHRQYERSQKPAPKGSFEAGHAQHFGEKSKPNPSSSGSRNTQSAEEPRAEIKEPEAKRGLWVPISFGIIAATGLIALIWLVRSSKKGG